MLTFKPKKLNNKIMIADKKTLQQQITLDTKHEQFVKEFTNNETEILPKLQEQMRTLKRNAEEYKTQHQIDKYLDTMDEQNEVLNTIKKMKQKKKKYFLDNAKYIFDYLENKKNIAQEQTTPDSILTETTITKPTNQSKQNIVDEFFKIKKNKELTDTDTDTYPFPSINENSLETTTQTKNSSIVQKYLHNIDSNYLDMEMYTYAADVCQQCFQGELISSEMEGTLICNKCFHSLPFLFETERQSFKEPLKEVSFYSYKRINHFKEIIAQVQGKVTTQIPAEVIRKIRVQVKKERIPLLKITYTQARDILRKLGYYKYYEHIPYILSKFGIEPPLFPPELEETLFNLFIEIQHPYSKHCPSERLNFLNYYYTGYKLCELLGETKFLFCFPMLKETDKKNEQDMIWKKICEELEWEFIPTI
jgi:hypothetical protein